MQHVKEPWLISDTSFPSEIFNVKGMIGRQERKMLYAYTRQGLEGLGQVVDAGAFIGSSCLCLASGMASSNVKKNILIHSFDLFSAQQPDVADSICNLVRPIKIGDGFLDIFKLQTEKYQDRIKIYEGDFTYMQWSNELVELLFIDICKTPELNDHVLNLFMHKLIPGKSLVIQQDFLHVWHPYIHWSMGILEDYFDIEASLVDSSRVYRLIKAIPAFEITRITDGLIGTKEKVHHLRKLGSQTVEWQQQLSEVLVLRQLVIDAKWPEFNREWAIFTNKYKEKLNSGEDRDWMILQGELVFKNAMSGR